MTLKSDCTCGAPTDGKWADVHASGCGALKFVIDTDRMAGDDGRFKSVIYDENGTKVRTFKDSWFAGSAAADAKEYLIGRGVDPENIETIFRFAGARLP